MGLSVQEILTRVQRSFGDEAQAQLTQADVIRWINDAQREIATNNNLLQVKASADTVSSQNAYALPTGILRLHSVRWQGRVLQALSLAQVDELTSTADQTVAQGYPVGTPMQYYIWAQQLYLYPAPQTGGTGDLSIYYTRQPVAVATVGDVPELPDAYHNRIVDYCMARAYELDENFFIASLKDQSFNSGVDKLRQDASWTQQETYPFITTPEDDITYQTGGWY